MGSVRGRAERGASFVLRRSHLRLGPDTTQMAKARVMYWKEIPVQVQATDEAGQVSKQLDPRFQEGVDAVSMFDGSAGSDDYLMAWEWGEYSEVEGDGDAGQAASVVAQKYNEGFPDDFVARIRDLERAGHRNSSPGAIDDWMSDAAD